MQTRPDDTVIQGYVTQVKCDESPFFINLNGDISYRNEEDIILELNEDIRAKNDAPHIVKALNVAYKYGYEKDRWR